MPVSFSIGEWAVWAPGIVNRKAFLTGKNIIHENGEGGDAPDVSDLPMMLRRRLSRLGKMAMRVSKDSAPQAVVPMIFSSRYGESAQTVKLLQSLSLQEPLSPANFGMSVHNGLAGQFSIMTKNTKPHTAIAAGKASFCNGLLEAGLQLNSGDDAGVLLVHYDEMLPDFYCGFVDSTEKPLALALYLEKDGHNKVTLSCEGLTDRNKADDKNAAYSFLQDVLGKNDTWRWSDGRTQWMCENGV